MLVAIKFCDDRYFNNRQYAKIGGVKCKELNAMESQFLKLTLYDLHILPQTFEVYSTKLLTQESEEVIVAENMKVNPPEQKGIETCLSQASFKTVSSAGDLHQE